MKQSIKTVIISRNALAWFTIKFIWTCACDLATQLLNRLKQVWSLIIPSNSNISVTLETANMKANYTLDCRPWGNRDYQTTYSCNFNRLSFGSCAMGW